MVSYSLAGLIAAVVGAAGLVAGACCAVLVGLKVTAAYDKLRAVHNGEPDELHVDLTQPHERLDAEGAWLDQVQRRADMLCCCGDEECKEDLRKLAEEDVPRLIAEARRLAAAVDDDPYATEADDFYEERHEGITDGANV